jgi:hypothetical protein
VHVLLHAALHVTLITAHLGLSLNVTNLYTWVVDYQSCMLNYHWVLCHVQETDAGREAGPDSVGSEFRGVLRSELLRVLAAALPPGTIQPSAQVVEVVSAGGDQQPQQTTSGRSGAQQLWPVLRLSSGEAIQGSVVVGADGARSSVAGAKGLGLPPPKYAGYVAHR